MTELSAERTAQVFFYSLRVIRYTEMSNQKEKERKKPLKDVIVLKCIAGVNFQEI